MAMAIKLTKDKIKIKARFYTVARVRCMEDHAKITVRSSEGNQIILNPGTNYLLTDKTPMQICNDIINLASFIKDNLIQVVISFVALRNDQISDRGKTVNDYLINICKSACIKYIGNENIQAIF